MISALAPAGGCLAGAVAFGADAADEHACRRVGRVLRHELAAESRRQNRLIESVEEGACRTRFRRKLVYRREGMLDPVNDFRPGSTRGGSGSGSLSKSAPEMPCWPATLFMLAAATWEPTG